MWPSCQNLVSFWRWIMPNSQKKILRLYFDFEKFQNSWFRFDDEDDDQDLDDTTRSRQDLSRSISILTYEAVEEIDLEFTRPIIILGPLKDRLNDDLMREYPNRYNKQHCTWMGLNNHWQWIWVGLDRVFPIQQGLVASTRSTVETIILLLA